MPQFDIAIIGGGLVGASLVHALAGSGLSVLLIDKSNGAELYKPELDNRGLALAYTTKQSLEQINLWQDLHTYAYAIEQVHVSEQDSFGFTKLTAKQANLSALGYLISASRLGMTLIQNLAQFAYLTQLRPESIIAANFDTQSAHWTLQLTTQTVHAKLLIAADGTNSLVRKLQNIAVIEKNFDQSAIVCNLNVAAANSNIAFERFTHDGVLAMLPFGNQRVKCIWTLANDLCREYMALTDADFLAHLQHAMGFRLGKILAVDERKNFPIAYSYAERLIGQASVLLGNAANTLHPVAAQGFNLGMRDAMTLARLLHSTQRYGGAVNSAELLQQYANLRAYDHDRTRKFSNNLVEIFAIDKLPIKTARRLGLAAAQFIPGVKDQLIAHGLGKWM